MVAITAVHGNTTVDCMYQHGLSYILLNCLILYSIVLHCVSSHALCPNSFSFPLNHSFSCIERNMSVISFSCIVFPRPHFILFAIASLLLLSLPASACGGLIAVVVVSVALIAAVVASSVDDDE